MKATNTREALINQKRNNYEAPYGFIESGKKSDSAAKSNHASPVKDKLSPENLKKLETKLIGGGQNIIKPSLSNSPSKFDSVAHVLSANQAKLKEGITRLDKEKVANMSSSNVKFRQASVESVLKDSSIQAVASANLETKQIHSTNLYHQNNSSLDQQLSRTAVNTAYYLPSNDGALSTKNLLPNISNEPLRTNQQSLNKQSNMMYRSLELSNSGLANSGISNLRPTDVKILQSHGVQPMDLSSRNRGRQQNSQDGDYETQPLGVVREVELEEFEKYKRSNKFKSAERERSLDHNIWKKIDELNQQKAENEHKIKLEKKKNAQEEWLATLKQQVAQKQVKKIEEKEDEIDHYKKRVAVDLKLQLEAEQKHQMHKEYIRETEKKNYYDISQEKQFHKKAKEQEKDVEIQRLNGNIDDYAKQQNRIKEEQLKSKKELNKIMTENILSRAHQKSLQKAEDNNNNIKIIEGLVEKKLKEEDDNNQFREWLRDKSRKMKDPNAKSDKNYDNLRKYGDISKNTSAQEGVMGFLYSDKNDEKINAEKRAEQNAVLKGVYEVQKQQADIKNKEHKVYVNEQNGLWKEEEYQMNLREDLTAQANKLKKQIQKEDLDAQRELDALIKSGSVGPHDIWVNRKTLKELKSVPEEYSRKIAYARR